MKYVWNLAGPALFSKLWFRWILEGYLPEYRFGKRGPYFQYWTWRGESYPPWRNALSIINGTVDDYPF